MSLGALPFPAQHLGVELDPTAQLSELIRTDGDRRGLAYRVVLMALAGFFFVLGVVFWLIPVVTGIPFYIVAFALLGMSSRRVARWINARESRLPQRHRVRLRRLLRRPA